MIFEMLLVTADRRLVGISRITGLKNHFVRLGETIEQTLSQSSA